MYFCFGQLLVVIKNVSCTYTENKQVEVDNFYRKWKIKCSILATWKVNCISD